MGTVASHISHVVAREFHGEDSGHWLPTDYPLFERGVLDWTDLHRLADLLEREFSLTLPEELIDPQMLRSAEAMASLVHALRALRPSGAAILAAGAPLAA